VAEIDPGEYDVAELTAKIKEIENPDVLREILAAEEAGEDRGPVKTVIESRIEKFTEEAEAVDAADLDPGDLTLAELGNVLTDVDDPEVLEGLLEREEAGEDRKGGVRLIEQRIDSVSGSEEAEAAEVESPEEKYPELDHPTADKQYVGTLAGGVYEDMWVYCETQVGDLIDVSREMLGKAREIMDGYNERYDADERVVAVLIGDDVASLAEEAVACGADVVVYREDPELERFRHKAYAEVFAALAREDAEWRDYDEPRYALFPATNNGRDLSAQVQAELDSGLASDCSDLYVDDTVVSNPAKTGGSGQKREFERVLHMKRPDFSGFEYSTILCLDSPTRDFHPQGASVIPGSFDLPEPDASREGEVIESDVDLDEDWFHVEVTEHDRLEGGIDLTGYDVIVALGRGIGDDPTRGMELGLELRDAFDDAELGISRGIVTSSYDFEGHVAQYAREERQIGETGQVVEPDLYVAAGISGAVQHKVGMDESGTIVAINTDPDADIREFSDYFIEGDLFEVLPRLAESLEAGELTLPAGGD